MKTCKIINIIALTLTFCAQPMFAMSEQALERVKKQHEAQRIIDAQKAAAEARAREEDAMIQEAIRLSLTESSQKAPASSSSAASSVDTTLRRPELPIHPSLLQQQPQASQAELRRPAFPVEEEEEEQAKKTNLPAYRGSSSKSTPTAPNVPASSVDITLRRPQLPTHPSLLGKKE